MAKRKPKHSVKSQSMRNDRFWKMIEESRQTDDFYATLSGKLADLPADDIVAFQNTLRRKLADAHTFPVLAANFIIQSYVSDDVFEDFRAWLVTQGRERFESAVSDPESICDWFKRREVDDMDGGSMIVIAGDTYEEQGNDIEEFDERIKYPREPKLKIDWPANKEGYRQRWPRLVRKFWNLERIRELHSH